MVADRLSKIAHFIACNETNDVTHIVELYFKGVIRIHGIDPLFFIKILNSLVISRLSYRRKWVLN